MAEGASAGSDDVDLAAVAAFAVDELAAFLGAHAGAEADFADAFAVGDFVGVMHKLVRGQWSEVRSKKQEARRQESQ